jgi:hypothetical protein
VTGPAPRFAQDVWWVAVYEVGEAVRTRLLQLVLLGYAAGIGGACWLLIRILRELEAPIAAQMGLPATERPGALMEQLLASDSLRSLVSPLADGSSAAADLLQRPLLGVWAGAASMVLLPMVLLFASSGSIAAEVGSRSIRYLACRTGRLQIGLGKLLGQLLLAGVAAAVGIGVAFTMGMTMMVGNEPGALLGELLLRTGRACAYALPFAGIGLTASAWIPSANGARFAAAASCVGLVLVDHQLDVRTGDTFVGRLADLGRQFIATGIWPDLWSLRAEEVTGGVLRCVVLAVVYYAVGHARFGRRDL